MGRKYWKWTRTKGSELMNIEGFAFCNCSFFFSWPNSHSLLLVRVKLWSSKDSCKKRFLLYCLSLNMKFAYFFSIFFFEKSHLHHFCLITSFYTSFLWSFLLYCALTPGCFPSLSFILFFPFLWMVLISFTWIYSRKYTWQKQNSSQESYFSMGLLKWYYVLKMPHK